MPSQSDSDFLSKLQAEAAYQSKVTQSSLLPKQLQGVARLVVEHTVPFLIVISGITSVAVSLVSR